jgi:hypothetical protein
MDAVCDRYLPVFANVSDAFVMHLCELLDLKLDAYEIANECVQLGTKRKHVTFEDDFDYMDVFDD